MKTKGIIFVVIAGMIYGFTPVLCTFTYQLGNNPFSLTFFRSLFVLPILAGLMLYHRISFRCTRQEMTSLGIVAVLGSVLTTLLLYSSYTYIGVGTSTTLHFLYPLFVTLICYFVYHEKLQRKQWISLFLCLFGIAFFFNYRDLSKLQGIMMAIISGFTFSIYLVGIERFHLVKMNNYKLSFYLALWVSFTLLIIHLFHHQIIFVQPLQSYIYMIIIAIFAQMIAVLCLKEGIAILGSALASLLSMVEPISSIVFGVLFLSETVTIAQIFGCIVIMFAIGLLIKK